MSGKNGKSSKNSPSMSLLFSLRGRLLFLICLATLPAILFTFFAAKQERAAVLVRAERDALHLAVLTSREHAQQIQGARELLSWLGAKLAREGLESLIITDPAFLRALLAGHPQLANIGVLSPDGRVLGSAFPLASYRSWNDNPAYLAALRSNDVVAGTYLVSPIFERPTLNHAYAVRDHDGEVIAVLFDGLDLEWLSELGEHIVLPEGFSLLVLDHEGRVLAHGFRPTELPDIGDLQIPDIVGLAQSRRGRTIESDGNHVPRYFVATPMEGAPGLFVAVGLPFEQIVGEANAAFYRVLIGLGLLTLFVVTAVFVAAEFGVLRSLRALARVAHRFGAGELSARATVPHVHNEIASLATAFNTMAASLDARHRDALEARGRLKALAARIQVAREEEAARISRELHDEIGQVLTSLKIDISRLPMSCAPDDLSPAGAAALRERTAEMSLQIDTAITFVRRISSDLRPGVLDRLGLVAALEWQARETEARTGLVIQVEADVGEETLDDLVSVTLFRIAQEALNNIVRHAEARVVEIDLVTTAHDMILTVRDDGKGITRPEIEGNESLGLMGMNERATLVDGHLSISGSPGQGTVVTVTVPLQLKPRATDAHPAG